MPSTTSGTTATGSTGAGMDTSSIAPDSTRWDFAGARPSTLTLPAATRSAARVRENPNMRARAVSTRSPARPSGIGHGAVVVPPVAAGGASRDRRTHCAAGGSSPVRRGWVRVPSRATPRAACTMMNTAATLMHMSATLKIGQWGSCDEVDDVASHRTRRPEDPVGEVAEDARQQEAEPQGPADAPQPPRDPQRGQGGSDGHHGQQHRVRRPGAERRTRVPRQVELQEVTDHVHRRPVGELGDGQRLGHHVERVAEDRDTGEDQQGAGTGGCRLGVVRCVVRWVGRVAGRQRRSSRCLHGKHSVARGKAITRSLPIG